MSGLKAVISGIVTILILGLITQVAVLLAEVGYNNLSNSYPFIDPYKQWFVYSTVAIGFALVMLCGGYITAAISRQKIYTYSFIAAFVACGISLWSSLVTEVFTSSALLFLIYGITFSLLGSWFWKKYDIKAN
jgi:hypothetical protein